MNTLLNKQVVVEHPETGRVITFFKKLNKEGEEVTYGKVRIDSMNLSMNNGFVSTRRRTAFLTLDSDALQLIGSQIKAGEEYPMEGKIVVKETLEPQWDGHLPKINPTTSEVIQVNGHQIYRSTEFTSNLNTQDVFVNPYCIGEPEEAVHTKEQVISEEFVM